VRKNLKFFLKKFEQKVNEQFFEISQNQKNHKKVENEHKLKCLCQVEPMGAKQKVITLMLFLNYFQKI
jgi:hypothetical protein